MIAMAVSMAGFAHGCTLLFKQFISSMLHWSKIEHIAIECEHVPGASLWRFTCREARQVWSPVWPHQPLVHHEV